MDAKVLTVDSVHLYVNKSNPPILVVQAQGTVNTSGWTNGRLVPWIYIERPKDGILDFDFIAQVPSGIVLHVISPIEGCGQVVLEDWMKGARVHSSTNKVEALLSDKKSIAEGRFLEGEEVPFPW